MNQKQSSCRVITTGQPRAPRCARLLRVVERQKGREILRYREQFGQATSALLVEVSDSRPWPSTGYLSTSDASSQKISRQD